MTSAGRPRDPRIDDALRTAVQALLVEQGYAGLTVQGAARSAGVSTAAIYRRFPGKRELVEWALFPPYEWIDPRYTGDYLADLTTLVQVLLDWLSQPATRAAVPGLLGEYVRDSARFARLLQLTIDPVVTSLTRVVDAAVAQGEARRDLPIEDLLDVALGAVLLEAMVREPGDLKGVAERIAEVLKRATA